MYPVRSEGQKPASRASTVAVILPCCHVTRDLEYQDRHEPDIMSITNIISISMLIQMMNDSYCLSLDGRKTPIFQKKSSTKCTGPIFRIGMALTDPPLEETLLSLLS